MFSQLHQPGAVPAVRSHEEHFIDIIVCKLRGQEPHCLVIRRDKKGVEVNDGVQFHIYPGLLEGQLFLGHFTVQAHHCTDLGAEIGLAGRKAFRRYDLATPLVHLIPEKVHHLTTVRAVRIEESEAVHHESIVEEAHEGGDLLGIQQAPSEDVLPEGGYLRIGGKGDDGSTRFLRCLRGRAGRAGEYGADDGDHLVGLGQVPHRLGSLNRIGARILHQQPEFGNRLGVGWRAQEAEGCLNALQSFLAIDGEPA